MKSKKIMIVAPKAHGLANQVIKEVRSRGDQVVFYPESIFEGHLLGRLINKLPQSFYNLINSKHCKRLGKLASQKDHVILIRIAKWRAEDLRAFTGQAKRNDLSLYQWDMSKNLPYLQEQLPFFKKSFSFDINDTKKFNMIYRPLFFPNDTLPSSEKKVFNYSFVGTDYGDRYKVISRFVEANQLENVFIALYRPLLSYVYHFLSFKLSSISLPLKEAHLKPINQKKCSQIYNKSTAVIDIGQGKQTGISLRCIEALFSNTKLITNNEALYVSDLYTEDNIIKTDFIINLNPGDFAKLKKPFKEIPKDTKEKYLVKNWVDEVVYG